MQISARAKVGLMSSVDSAKCEGQKKGGGWMEPKLENPIEARESSVRGIEVFSSTSTPLTSVGRFHRIR
jgi:hypothetical protein